MADHTPREGQGWRGVPTTRSLPSAFTSAKDRAHTPPGGGAIHHGAPVPSGGLQVPPEYGPGGYGHPQNPVPHPSSISYPALPAAVQVQGYPMPSPTYGSLAYPGSNHGPTNPQQWAEHPHHAEPNTTLDAVQGTAVLSEAVEAVVVQRWPVDKVTRRADALLGSDHSALVFLTRQASYRNVRGRLPIPVRVGWLWKPHELYTIDIAPHDATLTIDLPSRQEAFHFSANVRVVWQVTDAVGAVRTRLDAPYAKIKAQLERDLRQITREFNVEDNAAAEARLNHDYAHRVLAITDTLSLQVLTVVLMLDERTREHLAGRTFADRADESTMRTMVSEAVQQQLTDQRNEYDRRLESIQQQHALLLKQERVRSYADAIRSDTLNVLAMRLDGHGEDVRDVIGLLMEQRKVEYTEATGLLDRILDANLANRKDVDALMLNAKQALVKRMNGGDADFARTATPPIPAQAALTRDDPDFLDD